MASLLTNGHVFELSDEIKSKLLMSLMEELQDQVEESDEERLNSVIRSLEAEINSTTVDSDHDSIMECDDHQWTSDGEESQSSDLSQSEGQNWSISLDEFDVNGWIEMEKAMPCSPSNHHDIDSLCMYSSGDHEIGLISGEISNGFVHDCNEIAFDLGQGNSYLWQEALYDSVMYD